MVSHAPIFLRYPSSRGLCSPRLKALPAEDRASLRRSKWHSRLLAAARARGLRFHLGITVVLSGHRGRTEDRDPLALACLAALWLVLELFVVEEQLLPSREDEVGPTVNTLQHLVLKFH